MDWDLHYKRLLCLLLFAVLGQPVFAQNEIKELEEEIKRTNNIREKASLYLQLSSKLGKREARKAQQHISKAFDLAVDAKAYGTAAQAAKEKAQRYLSSRDTKNAEIWYKNTVQYAKEANDADLIIHAVSKLGDLNKRSPRDAVRIYRDAFNYFSKSGTSMSELEQNFIIQRRQIERERKELEDEKDRLEREIQSLSSDKNRLSREKRELTSRQKELVKEKEKAEEAIDEKTQELATIEEEKREAELKAYTRKREIDKLSNEALKKEIEIQDKELELEQSKTEALQARNLMYLTGMLGAIALAFLLVFFFRFRAKQKAASILEEKNQIIGEERKRSDELLLNILPAPIAQELKENGKAKARQFDDVTVLFSDFKNFTKVSEQLSPERLVAELDHCFKAFDFIISQYSIEKIKTIGDAYMCASGLEDRHSLPNDIVKAALEMQEFLNDYKQDRQRKGLPFFEARIGLHTGSVVAGVVGVNKFAYDIWGETVNIASRMESNSEVGQVNISDTTFQKIQYHFDCRYRGKVPAKNLGMIDMYWVVGSKG